MTFVLYFKSNKKIIIINKIINIIDCKIIIKLKISLINIILYTILYAKKIFYVRCGDDAKMES